MNNWKSLLISEDTKVLEAIRVIDSTDARVALVATEEGKLIGTITDGDIRRGILKGVNLESSVSCVLNNDPIIGKIEQTEDDYQAILDNHQILQLPLVDDNNHIQGFFIPNDSSAQRKNPVVLMVGGLGTRLGDLTTNCPKPMLRVGGKPILQTIISNFKSEGFHNFYLSVNYKSEVIENYFGNGEPFGVSIEYLRERKRMGTAGSLSLIDEELNEPIVVMNGDLLTSINITEMLKFHRDNNSAATMCVRNFSFQLPYGVVEADGTRMKAIQEKPTENRFINAGIYVIEPHVLSEIPKEDYFDMPSLFGKLVELGETVSVFPIREYWLDIGRREDFDRAHLEYGEVFE